MGGTCGAGPWWKGWWWQAWKERRKAGRCRRCWPTRLRAFRIYLDPLDRELERRGHCFSRYADDCNIYVGSQAAAERTMASIQGWIEKHLRLKVNTAKSGTGRVWERKFLGFRLNRQRQVEVAPESLERFKARVREMWRGCQSRTSKQLRDAWQRYVRGWWGYFRLAAERRPVFRLGAGSAGTSGNAFGCGGTMRKAGSTRYGGSGFILGCCGRCVRVAAPGLWRRPRRCTPACPTPCCGRMGF